MCMRTVKIIIIAWCFLVGFGTTSTKMLSQSEGSNFDSLKKEINEKMKKHKLHGLSVAVFEDYQVKWTYQWGVKASGSNDRIDTNTSFSTASTSKAIVAILCGILEEKGMINLDDPIANYLERWQLPKSEFAESSKISWMHLLSHTAGTTQGGFADFYEGDKIPTIVQSLKGELLPRYDREISFIFAPETNWQYSGGGYVIIQMALEDYFKKPLAELVNEYVFKPLYLKNTTMKQPNESGFLTNVAKVHNSKGDIIRTGLPITPQVAPSGMWSNPSDLSIIAIEMQNALRNKNNKVISQKVAKRITDVVSIHAVGGWSAGWNRSLGIGNQEWFSHGGSNTGVGGEFMATMNGGNGIAILANGDKPNRFPVMNYLRTEVFELLNWGTAVDESVVKEIPKDLKTEVVGSYLDFLYGAQGINKIFEENGKLFINSPMFDFSLGKKKNQMYYLGDNTFQIEDYPNYIQFKTDNKSKLKELVIFRNKEQMVSVKKEEIRNEKTQLIDTFSNHKLDVAIEEYKKIKQQSPDLNFEAILNEFGYLFYMDNKIDKAIAVLEFNRDEHPDSWNTYDSLGEIYEISGAFKKSAENFKRAQELNDSKEYKDRIAQKILELLHKS